MSQTGMEMGGIGNELMGMGGNGNAARHSRISLLRTIYAALWVV